MVMIEVNMRPLFFFGSEAISPVFGSLLAESIGDVDWGAVPSFRSVEAYD
jgi:hypothetical protein